MFSVLSNLQVSFEKNLLLINCCNGRLNIYPYFIKNIYMDFDQLYFLVRWIYLDMNIAAMRTVANVIVPTILRLFCSSK